MRRGYPKDSKGVLYITEMMVIVAVLGVMAALFYGTYDRYRERTRVRNAIHALFTIKKAIEGYSLTCLGYPFGPAYDPSSNSVENLATPGPLRDPAAPALGFPDTYPYKQPCSSTTLGAFVPGLVNSKGAMAKACDYTDVGCAKAPGWGVFSRTFVKAGGGHSGGNWCDTGYGWGYNLVPVTGGGGAMADFKVEPLAEPIAVYCGHAAYHDGGDPGWVTIVINSNGSGKVNTNNTGFGTPCPCGAWCEVSLTGKSGCCNNCDGAGTLGVSFRY
ncbi:MAG: hypothetical protein AB1742_05610 [bacterium]